ncbi:hypothetical protein BG011_010094 [Mortierella polycephala]|uniref:Prenylcysteine lyase domain-containing protein n=1 Tax=Mortierella polycephala TaxID=41804 RepID=A0A9P6QAP4_9FUNG|nr:hypothetical protein BG011_010094 [Mortierella polycephala]
MRIDYLSKVGAAVSAFFAPMPFYLSNGQNSHGELAPTKSVAIIGAGAGGASTAYFLHNYLQPPQSRYIVNHSITIFEQSDKIGGRCAAFRVRNPGEKDEFVEVGASIFVKVNRHLNDAVKEFGLKTKPLDNELAAIWNGKEFIFEESQWRFWSVLKGLRRWGIAPLKLHRLLKKTQSDMLQSYKSTETFDSIVAFAKRFQLEKVASVFSDIFLEENGIGKLYTKEIVEVATRVNYGSNLNEIHALGALVTMAAEDALQVQDGNFQLFEGMVGRSKAHVRLNTKVMRVRKVAPLHKGAEPRFEVTTASGHSEIFDSVVIAAPIHSTNIDFDLDLPPQPKVNYRTIHATFVRGHINPAYFNMTSADKLPSHILTTNTDAEFTSLSIQVRLSTGETVTKIFSPEPIQADLLDRLYSSRTWVKQKVWKAYPRMQPIPASLDVDPISNGAEKSLQLLQEQHVFGQQPHQRQSAASAAWGKVEIVPGVFYLNAFEPLISAMETETIAGKNIARLLRDRILGHCPVEKIPSS